MAQVCLDGRQDLVYWRGLRRQRVQRGLQMPAHVGDPGIHHLFDEILTRREVVVDRRCLKLRVFGDIGQPGTGIALYAENVGSGVEDATTGTCRLGERVRGCGVLPHHRFFSHDLIICETTTTAGAVGPCVPYDIASLRRERWLSSLLWALLRSSAMSTSMSS